MKIAPYVLLMFLGAVLWFFNQVYRQGLSDQFWQTYRTAEVLMDPYGVPTITAGDWQRVIEAQGYVTAAARLWQMEVMRRSGAGRLAEWFGDRALAHDEKRHQEGWVDVAHRAAAGLSREELIWCQAYADGVNQFMTQHAGEVGIEYVLLRQHPEPWTCADTLLIVMSLIEDMSGLAAHDARHMAWHLALTPGWEGFLFPQEHPWNQPLFGVVGSRDPGPELPAREEYLPSQAWPETANLKEFEPMALAGSNSWAYRGSKGLLDRKSVV